MGVQFSTEWTSAVLIVKAKGFFASPDDAAALQRTMSREQSKRHAVKIVVDVRGTPLLYTSEEWRSITALVLKGQATLTPIAFLAGLTDWPSLLEHCVSLGRHGRARYVFSEPERVEEWVGMDLPLRRHRDFLPTAGSPPCQQS
jgi:hypothetical protein